MAQSGNRPTAGALRWLRGSAVGVVATLLAWGGHVLAAGHAPGPDALLGSLALAVPAGVALSGRRWRLPSLVTALLVAQVAFHVAYADAGHATTFGQPMPGMAHGGTSMLLAHLGAAVLTALLLERGEDWCFALAHLLGGPWRGPTAGDLRPVAAPRRLLVAAPVAWFHLVLLAVSQQRRGPPVAVA